MFPCTKKDQLRELDAAVSGNGEWLGHLLAEVFVRGECHGTANNKKNYLTLEITFMYTFGKKKNTFF